MNAWPPLPLAPWKETCDTLHLYTQIAGKVRLTLTPFANQWWHVPLYVTTRGLTTSPIPCGERTFELTFDFHGHVLLLSTSDGVQDRVKLGGAVKDFYAATMAMLRRAGIEVEISTQPQEIPDAIPFEQDDVHTVYVPEDAHRFWQVLSQVDIVFKQFRGEFTGKCSPVHFFWGSFDLAVTRFSGKDAPPKEGADAITRSAYNAELSSVGFWPGGMGIEGAAFYSYAFPQPEGYAAQPVRPGAAHFDEKLGEFLLRYDDAVATGDPRGAILDFARSTYEAAASQAHWPSSLLLPAHAAPRKQHR